MIGLLLALYPARWRRRYGEEFRAVLESRTLGPFDVADVLLGALDARLTPLRLPGTAPAGGPVMLLRIGGFGAVGGGVLWFVGLAGATWLDVPDGSAFLVVAMFGMAGLLLALIGLSAFQAQRTPLLAWAALLIPALGSVASIVGMFGMLTRPSDAAFIGPFNPWDFWFLGLLATFAGSVLFAVATVRADVLSRGSAITLAISAVAVIVAALGFSGSGNPLLEAVLTGGAMALFSGSWVALGLSALRRGPIRALAPA